MTFLEVSQRLNQVMKEINLQGEIKVIIPADEWSRFTYNVSKEFDWMNLYETGPQNFLQLKICDIIFESA